MRKKLLLPFFKAIIFLMFFNVYYFILNISEKPWPNLEIIMFYELMYF